MCHEQIASLKKVLEATGFFPDGEPAPGLSLGDSALRARHTSTFVPDAVWRSPSALSIYFKLVDEIPDVLAISQWRREVWNEGFAPLLWVISPERIDLYNGFGVPANEGDASNHLVESFQNVESSLCELDALAGRLAIETGQFWAQAPMVNRKTTVDQKLLADLAKLEHDLVETDLDREMAQALIGRVIFTQYLIDRGIVDAVRFKRLCGHATLAAALRDRSATRELFAWLSSTFNGDMFPETAVLATPKTVHLSRVADFLEAVDPNSGQINFFPYQFDIIPVELISSIYEQFAHAPDMRLDSGQPSRAREHGVHYTRLSLVSLVLDEVMDGLSGTETVLDLTCGSGVFLVETLRRLVGRRAGNSAPTRELIRSILYDQVYGVDISEAAIRVAAFSLYLAALELDPDPQPPHSLKFRPLIGKTLLVGDAHDIERHGDGKQSLFAKGSLKKFDLIVGNPPWSFKGRAGTAVRRRMRGGDTPALPRGEGFDFVLRAVQFSHEKTRFGIILNALPFFSRSDTGISAALHVLKLLAPVTLVNLANLRSWLFATASMPAIALFARHRPQPKDQVTIVQIPWTTSSARTHTFEISPSDILSLSIDAIERQPIMLKAATVGRRRDIALLDSLVSRFPTLGERFTSMNVELHVGLVQGNPVNRTRNARELRGLPLLAADDIRPFRIPDELPTFQLTKAQWPRSRDIYRSPVLIIKETLNVRPRAVVAVADRDLVYTNAYFGASLPTTYEQSAHLLAAILSSSLASWFFLMSGAEFGLKKMRLLRHDVGLLPVPDLMQSGRSDVGKELLQIEKKMQKREPSEQDWLMLDEAVLRLYGLDEADRVVIRDGLFRASWQWEHGREESAAPAETITIVNYATVFLSVIQGWLAARNKRRMRAEVFELPQRDALRVVRFVLEEGPGDTSVGLVQPHGQLTDILSRIGKRLGVKIAAALSVERELRIHGRNEVIIIKPAAQRYWMGICALDDADSVVAESLKGAAA